MHGVLPHLVALALCLGGCFMTADSSLWQRPRDGQRETARDTGADRAVDRRADAAVDRQRERSADAAADLINPALKRAWVQPAVTGGRTPCNRPKLAYHPTKKLVYSYGGTKDVCWGQTWTYDGAAKAWSKLCDTCPPGPRDGQAMVYDSARQVLVLFGGSDGAGLHNDLWELGAAGTWQPVPLATAPPPRALFSAAFDEKRNRLVIFGGRDATGALFDDVWEYDGQKWSGPFSPTVKPLPRLEAYATFVGSKAQAPTLRDKVVVLGGSLSSAENVLVDDMWTWDGSAWQQVCTSCTGTARSASPLGLDPLSGRLVQVGGWAGSYEIAGTMEYASGWALTSTLPTARDSAGLTYDASRDVFVLFGGNGDGCGDDCDQTWEYVVLP